ncbi:hypothetical protein Csa_007319 [Cucumis sativus]|uniref:Uncharacterized protein n=1 Tax=Cucumis sativus TaxID=3659 RepID=A0A0A0LWF5_CUCSA|nr:hypothetical protein Csa_007319 [Cucumis sativus]
MNKPSIIVISKMLNHQWLVFSLVVTLACFYFCKGDNVSYDSNAIIINGERRVILSGLVRMCVQNGTTEAFHCGCIICQESNFERTIKSTRMKCKLLQQR